jgi:hypothetical protein
MRFFTAVSFLLKIKGCREKDVLPAVAVSVLWHQLLKAEDFLEFFFFE